MQIVENVTQYDWWPYPATNSGELSSLWLPVSPDKELELLSGLATAWSGLEWLVMGTWHRGDRDLPAKGFADRYPGFARETIALSDSESPRGFMSHSEWCVADPASPHLHDVLTVIRKSRGKGVCLTLGQPSASKRTWYAVSMAATWRASLALEFESPRGLGGIQEAIIAQYLSGMVAAELVAMVPLDYHPLGGYVMLGGAGQLSTMADMLQPELSSFSAASVAKLFSDGGGAAL